MTTCNDPGLTSAVNYGNGLIQFTQKSFCSNGVCNDVTVCQVQGFTQNWNNLINSAHRTWYNIFTDVMGEGGEHPSVLCVDDEAEITMGKFQILVCKLLSPIKGRT